MPFRPVLLSYIIMWLSFMQLDNAKLMNDLGAGALALTILYMVIALLKTIKTFSAPPQVVVPSSIEYRSDPALVELLNRLVTITTDTRTIASNLDKNLAIAMDRQLDEKSVRDAIKDELKK